MPDSGKPERPGLQRLRVRDPRIESEPPSARDRDEIAGRRASGPRTDSAAERIVLLESQLARLKEERAADADDVAEMLVRIADAERAKAAALGRAAEAELQAEVSTGEADALREELGRRAEAFEAISQRVGLAEKSAADGGAALLRARADLEAERGRLVDLEAKLARTRREHSDALEAQRLLHAEEVAEALAAEGQRHAAVVEAIEMAHIASTERLVAAQTVALASLHDDLTTARHEAERALEDERSAAAYAKHEAERALEDERSAAAYAKHEAARTLEDERSAAARARQQIAAAETTLARAAAQLEDLARREEMAESLRARAVDQMRRTLAGEAPPPCMVPLATPAPVAPPVGLALEELDLDPLK